MPVIISRRTVFTPARISNPDSSSAGNTSWKGRIDPASPACITLAISEPGFINFLELSPTNGGNALFPSAFRIETSVDGAEWTVLHREHGFTVPDEPVLLMLPLTRIQQIRLVITAAREGSMVSIGAITAGIFGVRSADGTPLASGRWDSLFSADPSFIQSEVKSAANTVSCTLDMGSVYSITGVTLGSVDAEQSAFPASFSVELSADRKIWLPAFEEKGFGAERNTRWNWIFDPINARYLRFTAQSVAVKSAEHFIKLGAFEAQAAPLTASHAHSAVTPPHASVFQAGLVKIARDAEVSSDAVVRSDDRRLRDASTIFKGIMQFALDGQSEPLMAVQANDSRLKEASESEKGIVRLAYDRETNKGAAVQGSDSRLQEATDTKFGIVRICPDGSPDDLGVVRGSDRRLKPASEQNRGTILLAPNGGREAGTAVQANDARLKDASVHAKGIMQFAEDGEAAEERAVMASDRRLRKATTLAPGIIELAEDGETEPGCAVQGNDRRLRDATTETKGIVELAADGEDAPGRAVQGNDRRLRDATEKNKGIMMFAHNGESAAEKAVQGNDSRLKDATTTAKGIVRLASDGETAESAAVQGNDKRLRDATALTKGIMRFAADGETSRDAAVQGSDSRLMDATLKSKGIMRFADNGECAPLAAVQGNDVRLMDAQESRKGIVRLCPLGQTDQGAAVQGSDPRLKPATETTPGILRFARDGEAASNTAVQSDDARLKPASTVAPGIVELAEDGEDRAGVAVQGNDQRLKHGDDEHYGIMRFARHGEARSRHAVQADDPRLADDRKPLPHTHDYAPVRHSFSAHEGTLDISAAAMTEFSGITPPPVGASIAHFENTAGGDYAAGVTGISGKLAPDSVGFGVIGHGSAVGVRGQATGGTKTRGCGVLGVSRFGSGGCFTSEHDWALVADGFGTVSEYDPSLKLQGEGKALRVNGSSHFSGTITLEGSGKQEAPANIVELHELDGEDYTSPGDILVITEGGSRLGRTHTPYSKAVIGIVSGNPVLTMDTGATAQRYPVALQGTVICKVDARSAPIRPGDLIVTSSTPGCGMKGTVDSFDKIGSVIGKALTGLDSGIGTIRLIIARS